MTRIAPILNRKLDLQERVLTPDGSGGFDVSWVSLGLHYGNVELRRGSERLIAGRMVPQLSYIILVRAAPEGAASRPKPDQRFVEGNRIYDILAVAEHDPFTHYLEVWAEEGRDQ